MVPVQYVVGDLARRLECGVWIHRSVPYSTTVPGTSTCVKERNEIRDVILYEIREGRNMPRLNDVLLLVQVIGSSRESALQGGRAG